jgi:hypothetical protein
MEETLFDETEFDDAEFKCNVPVKDPGNDLIQPE